jgi:S-DNA-T family DNA segregation ATPase FtsK/SpoIIIE
MMAKFGHEIVLFFVAITLVLIALALMTHSPNDPAWSTTGTGAPIENWMQEPGAIFANIVYFLFGFSGWWLYLFACHIWFSSLRKRLSSPPEETESVAASAISRALLHWLRYAPLRRFRDVSMLGLLLGTSTILEWGRLHLYEFWLPDHAGGVVGRLLGPWAMHWLGINGSAVLSIAVLVIAVAQVFKFSWLHFAELLGRVLDGAWSTLYGTWQSRQDVRIGREALRHREEEPFLEPDPVAAESGFPATTPGSLLKEEHRESGQGTPENTSIADHHASDYFADEKPRSVNDRLMAVAQAFSATHINDDVKPIDERTNETAALASELQQSAVDQEVGLPSLSIVNTSPVLSSRISSAASEAYQTEVPAYSCTRQQAPSSVFRLPDIDLLDLPSAQQDTISSTSLESTSRLIEQKLKDFNVSVSVVTAAPGPVVTRYEIEPATGVKGAQIVNLSKDLARSLSLVSIRVVETIPGKNLMALELPNPHRQAIRLSEVLGTEAYLNAGSLLAMGLGKDIVGQAVVADLAKMPHCLVAGTTGSGKSVGINAMILSLLFRAHPHDVRLMLIDPKMLEMSVYEGIPHLLCPVVTDMKQAANGLNWCVAEMEKRYKLMSKLGVRNLAGYNTKIDEAQVREAYIPNPFSLTPEQPEPLERLPYIVVVIDELADLMMVAGKKIEELIARLAQKARAAGIHLILATQRPSVDVITGLIKANIPTRMSFQVSSKIDSRTILDQMGAEALLGMGDMLYMPSGTGDPIRVHGAFVSDDEVHRVVAHLREQCGEPRYIEGILEPPAGDGDSFDTDANSFGNSSEKDSLYDQAVEVVLRDRKASISYVQRKLNVGYNRAARLLEDMERAGLVSAMTNSGKRDILVPERTE